jgi:hypothetical protein
MKRYVLAVLASTCFVAPASASWGYCSAEGVGRKILYISAVFDSDYFADAGMKTGYHQFLESEGIKTGPAACASGEDQLAAIMIRNHAIDDALKIGVSVQPFGPF